MHIRTKYLLFFIVIFLTRLPFVFHGFGLDGDSWAVALASQHWHQTGDYEASRFPGNPVHELLCSMLSGCGDMSLILLTVFFTSVASLFFVMALVELRFRTPFLAGLALAFVPVIYINSAIVIDYNISLAFIMMAFYFAAVDRSILTGVCLGLAIGCRITSGAMLIPFGLMLLRPNEFQRNLMRIFFAFTFALLVGAIAYFPSFVKYGWSFLSYYEVQYPSLIKILYRFFIETWGLVGCFALVVGIILLFLPKRFTKAGYLFPRSVNIKHVIAWLLAIDLYIIAFIKLPMEAGYMIPAIPFVILVFGKYLVRPAFILFCCLLIAAPFFFGISPANRIDSSTPSLLSYNINAGNETLTLDILKGPLLTNESREENSSKYVRRLLDQFKNIRYPVCLIAGQWYNHLVYLNGDTVSSKVLIAPHVDKRFLLDQLSKGRKLFYLTRQNEFNLQLKGADPRLFGASEYK